MESKPTSSIFLYKVKKIKEIENYIALRNKKLKKHKNKWQAIVTTNCL